MAGCRRSLRALIIAAIVVGTSVVAPGAGAQAYRYKDDNGNWVYTDRPPPTVRGTESVNLPAGASTPRIVVEPRSASGRIAMVAVNECECPVEFGLKVKDGDGRGRAARQVVAPRSEVVLLEVPAPPGMGEIAFDYGYVIGEPGVTHAPTRPYRAPFGLAQAFTVSQAPPDAVTHRDVSSRNAVDIAMPVGTAVHAAREGRVINVAHQFFRGGLAIENREEANFVQVLHDDGTTAIYAHLQMDTIRVRPGQRVQRGEYIANSGNTGFSSGPHLHFVVLRNVGLRSESLPVLFAGPGDSGIPAQTGRVLTAY
jgi:murein DD-endopeptidase MepM/ murein hydrolase activator NlpD